MQWGAVLKTKVIIWHPPFFLANFNTCININVQHMHWAYCPLPMCALRMVRQSGDIPGGGSPLMGWRAVTVPGSGTWVWCRHGLIYGDAQDYAGCCRHRDRHRGNFRETGVCGFVVTGIAGATGGGCSSCAGLAGAGNVTEMWGLAEACSMADVTAGVVSVGLTLLSQRCCLMQQTTPSLVCTW